MRNTVIMAALAALMLFAPLAVRAGQDAPAGTVEGMTDEVIAEFPRAEGHVTAAGDGSVSLDIGSAAGLKTGMELLLFRPGKPIIHPVTRVVLGSTEEPLGRARVTELREGSSEAKVTELLVTRIVDGDIARLSTTPSKLLVVVQGPEFDTVLLDRTLGRLRASGRFEVMGPPDDLHDGPLAGPDAASMAAAQGAQFVLLFASAPAADKMKMNVSMDLFGADGGIRLALSRDVDATPEVYDESVMEFPLVRGDMRDFFVTEELGFRGKHMDAGNLMGGPGTEIAVSDGFGLIVFRFEDRILRELWREEGQSSNQHLSVECADLNGNGLDEIYVTNFSDGVIKSYVVEYRDGGFRTVFGPVGVLFRVLDVPGRGSMLLTTTTGSDAPYSGIIYEYAWEGGSLVRKDRVELPDRIKDPYGFVLVDLVPDEVPEGGGESGKDEGPFPGLEYVWVDDSDYVQVLSSDGERLWKSPEHYGGYDNYFELDKRSLALPTVEPRGKVKGRLCVREESDGRKVIVVTRNVPMTYYTQRFKGYSTSDIIALVWDGTKMEEGWGIRNIEGYIADIYMGELMGAGREEILTLVEPTIKILKKSKSLPVGSIKSIANIGADKSSLMMYKVPLR